MIQLASEAGKDLQAPKKRKLIKLKPNYKNNM
jgi:hypothetical protein